VKFPNANINNRIVSKEENSFVIEHLNACVGFEVSVRAANEKGVCSGAVCGNTTTETDGNCYNKIYYIYLVCQGLIKDNGDLMFFQAGYLISQSTLSS
jgi:hypothetical protein